MSSIYEHLARTEAELNKEIAEKLPKTKPAAEPKVFTTPPLKPRLFGIKLLILFALIFSVGSLAASVYFFQAMNHSRQESLVLQNKLQSLSVTAESLTEKSAYINGAINAMQTDINGLNSGSDALKTTLNRTLFEISSIQDSVAELQGRSGAIENEIDRIKAKVFFEKVPPAAEDENLPRIISTPSNVEKMGPQEQSELSPVLTEFNDEIAEPAAAVAEGTASEQITALPLVRVMTVNRKFNFVVVNAGLKDNLRLGDRLDVSRGEKSIGRVEIEKLYDDFSAATIVSEKKDQEIQESDAIALS